MRNNAEANWSHPSQLLLNLDLTDVPLSVLDYEHELLLLTDLSSRIDLLAWLVVSRPAPDSYVKRRIVEPSTGILHVKHVARK